MKYFSICGPCFESSDGLASISSALAWHGVCDAVTSRKRHDLGMLLAA